MAKLTERQRQGVREMGATWVPAKAEALATLQGTCLFSLRQYHAMASYWLRWVRPKHDGAKIAVEAPTSPSEPSTVFPGH